MPIHIRNFYYKQLVDAKEAEKNNIEKNQNTTPVTKGPNVRVRK